MEFETKLNLTCPVRGELKATRKSKDGLPPFGADIMTKPITFADTKSSDSLLDIFSRIEDLLHKASFDHEKRYEIILQLLLTKIFDEHQFETRVTEPMGIQDFSAIGIRPDIAFDKVEKLVERAISFYEKHLPNKIQKKISLKPETLAEILQILAPIRVIHSKRDVVQTFYMKFAKDIYKWDLAQYFTPTTVTDFIVDVLNPQFGEHVCDPACGSADFLIAAFRIGRKYNPGYADSVWGVDNSSNAVQIAVLNMLLNGDGKTNIRKDDSLENVEKYTERYDIMVCNPPFGSRIVEKRTDVLRKFDLGKEITSNGDGTISVSEKKLVDAQETGILFVEVCIKQCKPMGRIAIILPNGYLGNRSQKYRMMREWLIRQAKIVGIVSFPRFTFKSSGADVSASVIFLEKRQVPIQSLDGEDYSVFIEMIEKVGWDAGNKKATPIYLRNEMDGALKISDDGDPIIDSDFPSMLERIRGSSVGQDFSWVGEVKPSYGESSNHLINVKDIVSDKELTFDPKRYCFKIRSLVSSLKKKPHVLLGDIVDFLEEKKSSNGTSAKVATSAKYHYVELQDIGYGEYYTTELRGWQLPSRAKHFAEEGDIYFGSIWGSVVKWCYIGKKSDSIIVTNGCHRCRIKKGQEERLLDLLCYLNSEGWGAQMRAMSRGSDGLAEVSVEDARNVVIPILEDKQVRAEIRTFVNDLMAGRSTLNRTIEAMIDSKRIGFLEPAKRPSHIVLV